MLLFSNTENKSVDTIKVTIEKHDSQQAFKSYQRNVILLWHVAFKFVSFLAVWAAASEYFQYQILC